MGAGTATSSTRTETDHHARDHRLCRHRHRGPHRRQLCRALPVLALAAAACRRRRGLDQVRPAPLPPIARAAPADSPPAARTNPGTRPALPIGNGRVARPGTSVRDAGELLAGVLQLAGPLAGPAESAGGLAAHVGGCGTAGEVDVLAPVHPPRIGAARVAWEVPGQFPEEPVHDLCPPAVPP